MRREQLKSPTRKTAVGQSAPECEAVSMWSAHLSTSCRVSVFAPPALVDVLSNYTFVYLTDRMRLVPIYIILSSILNAPLHGENHENKTLNHRESAAVHRAASIDRIEKPCTILSSQSEAKRAATRQARGNREQMCAVTSHDTPRACTTSSWVQG